FRDIFASAPRHLPSVYAIRQQPPCFDIGSENEHGRQTMLDCEISNQGAEFGKEWAREHEDHLRRVLSHGSKCCTEIEGGFSSFSGRSSKFRVLAIGPTALNWSTDCASHRTANRVFCGKGCVSNSSCFCANSNWR